MTENVFIEVQVYYLQQYMDFLFVVLLIVYYILFIAIKLFKHPRSHCDESFRLL